MAHCSYCMSYNYADLQDVSEELRKSVRVLSKLTQGVQASTVQKLPSTPKQIFEEATKETPKRPISPICSVVNEMGTTSSSSDSERQGE